MTGSNPEKSSCTRIEDTAEAAFERMAQDGFPVFQELCAVHMQRNAKTQFELLVGNLQVPGRFDHPSALLKLGSIGFVEMSTNSPKYLGTKTMYY